MQRLSRRQDNFARVELDIVKGNSWIEVVSAMFPARARMIAVRRAICAPASAISKPAIDERYSANESCLIRCIQWNA